MQVPRAPPLPRPEPPPQTMKLLAFDTSTELISVAVMRAVAGVAQIWQHTGAGGAQASSALIPVIEQLMAEAGLRFDELDAVAFGQGPGSFTGLRTACAVAQGLGFGAGRPVLPVDTLLAVAEEARHQFASEASECHALLLSDSTVLAGNVFTEYGERLPVPPELPRWQALPTATAMLRLAPALLAAGHAVDAAHALPRYIRDKVAKTTLERAVEKAAS
jgi:tRNA threonylcarbamoyladenosine biosynthesis protein TsaB